MKKPLLSASNLFKTFKEPQNTKILTDVSLTIETGESIAIVGRSGEGKTTLLHILGTLEPFDSGKLFIQGNEITSTLSAQLRNRHFGFIFQSFNLLEDFTALENVLMPARIGRRCVNRQKGLELLDAVGLISRAQFPARLLSGGERQRVSIARALCNDPDILFADEPSGNLDRANADAVGNLLFDLVGNRKKALILVTHDPSLAARCKRCYSLSEGKLTSESFSS